LQYNPLLLTFEISPTINACEKKSINVPTSKMLLFSSINSLDLSTGPSIFVGHAWIVGFSKP
jgi:hypothetical protein